MDEFISLVNSSFSVVSLDVFDIQNQVKKPRKKNFIYCENL